MFLFIVEPREEHRTSWCSVCDITGYAHFSAQTVMSPNKHNQVNNCATSSTDLLLERGPYGRILLDTTRSPLLMWCGFSSNSPKNSQGTLRALKKETDCKFCYVPTVVVLLHFLDLIIWERHFVEGTAEITICKSCWNIFRSQMLTFYWN